MRLTFIFLFLSALLVSGVSAQDEPILLVNASFEDFPRQGKSPRGWYDCGFPSETPPDVQPSDNPTFAFFQVTKPSFEGETYLGMVVRDNDTWEMVSQRLITPLKAGDCYEFSLHLARSELYVSPSRTTLEEANYTTPAKLRIWGGSGYCNKGELLAESTPIINTRWLKYDFRFEPTEQHTYIVLEAFYNTPTLFPYNGNVLIDNASAIVPVPCDDETPVVAALEEKPEEPTQAEEQPRGVDETYSPPEPEVVETEDGPEAGSTDEQPTKIIAELDRSNLRKGQTIRIDKLYFEADSSKIKQESLPVLAEIFNFLSTNEDVVVEIGGHTNANPPHEYCDQLSTARAQAVAEFLATKGIERKRLFFRGYGKRQPVATNATSDGRRMNQRVEIKILSFDG